MVTEKINLSDYDYQLPDACIAQYPSKTREASRLCVYKEGKFEHRMFPDIIEYFSKGDCLILNNTKVIPARLFGKRKTGGKVEIFLLEEKENNEWEVLGRPARYMHKGERLYFDNDISCEITSDAYDSGKRIVRFSTSKDVLFKIGHVPLPPYIRRDDEPFDSERYQTVYADKPGAVASPTAGLHFTPDIIDKIKAKGVEIAKITLHVGIGTFRLIDSEDVRKHEMHEEFFEIDETACDIINNARAQGGRVFSVGTTSAKAVETAARNNVPLHPMKGMSDLFIYPGFKFNVIDALITNFHMPRSTLLLLVSAFAGYDVIMGMYKEAMDKGYRFLSYGDSTLLFKN